MGKKLQISVCGGLIWYADGSKTNVGSGAGVYGGGTRKRLSFNLGQYTTVLRVEVHAIKSSVTDNTDRSYESNIYILSKSQATPNNYQINIKWYYWYGCHISEARFHLHLQVKPTQLGPIDRASPYLQIPVSASRCGIQAKHSINHLWKLRKH
jgi:hypothetical protein